MDRLLLTLGIIFVSFTVGYAIRLSSATGRIPISETTLTAWRILTQKIAMFVLIPCSAMLSLWGLPSPDGRLLVLPFLGITAWTVGGGAAILLSGWMGLDRRKIGSMFCCGCFTNIGAVGSLVAVMLYGESTIAIASLYRLCEELFYFAIAYPIAQWYSLPAEGNPSLTLKGFRVQPVLKVVLTALGVGIALNLLGVPRPAVFGTIASGFMIAGTICFLLSIGMGLRLSRLSEHFKPSLIISLIKFAIIPVLIFSLGMLFGLGKIDDGLPLRVVFILASMPVAMNAVIPPSLFKLDLDLANACWVFTTIELIIVLPVLMLILPLI